MNQQQVFSRRPVNVKLELDPRFECPICLDYLNNPFLTSCGHKFCFVCIDSWLQQKKYCPIDEEVLTKENIFKDNYTEREILATEYKCPYEQCTSRINIPEYDTHVNQCKYKPKSLESVSVDITHKYKTKNNLQLTIFAVEDSMQVSKNLQATYYCTFYQIGCKEIFKTETLLERHLEIKTSFHLDLVRIHFCRGLNMKSEMDAQSFKQYDEASRDKPDVPGKHLVRQEEVNTLHEGNAGTDIIPPCERNQKEIDSYLLQNKDQESQLWEPAKQSPGETNKNLMRLMYERIVLLEQSKLELEIEVNRLKQNEDNIMLRLCNGVHIWRIDQFYDKLREMKLENKNIYYSPYFYSSMYGYRFCTRLNISREDPEYLSLYIHLVQGENDDILSWPFIGKIIFSALNKAPEKCVIDEIKSNRNLDSFKRPLNSFLNKRAFGFSNFIKISDVLSEDNSFLDENGTFIIKTQIIEG